MKNQRGFAALEAVLILIIVAILGGVVWYVVKQNKDVAEPTTSTISKTKEPVEEYKPTTTVPDDWKTYTNEKYKISFAYPGDSKVEISEGKASETDVGIAAYKEDANVVEFTISAIKDGGEGGNSLLMSFYAFDLPVGKTVENLKKYYDETNEADKDDIDPLFVLFVPKEITFLGKKGYEVATGIGHSDDNSFQYYVESNGYTFQLPEINPHLDPSGNNSNDVNISRVIVDSIKFL